MLQNRGDLSNTKILYYVFGGSLCENPVIYYVFALFLHRLFSPEPVNLVKQWNGKNITKTS